MSSIPLPALNVQPPQDQTPNLERLMNLRLLLQQAPLQKQELEQRVQASQLANQQAAQQLKDQQALTTAMSEWDGKDWQQLPSLVLKHGGSGIAAIGAKKQLMDQQEQLGTMAKTDLENLKNKHDQLAGSIQNVIDLPDGQIVGGLGSAVQDAVKSGLADDPAKLQQAAGQLSQLPPDQLRLRLKAIKNGLLTSSQQADENLKAQQAATSKAEQGKSEAETQKIQAEQQGLVGQFAEAKYRRILGDMTSGKQVSDADLTFAKSYELANRKTTTSSDSLGVTSSNTSGPSGLSAVGNRKGGRFVAPGAAGNAQPSAASPKESLVDAIGQYKVDPATISRMFFRHPEMIGLVTSKYPDFDQTNYGAKAQLMKGYTSGTQSKEINAINTVAGHLDVLDQAVAALNNNDVTLLNKIGNKIGTNVTGQTAPAAFKTILHRVGPEITTAYVQGGGGEAERLANAEDFSENLPPQTLHNNIAKTVQLLDSKIGALENQYKNTVQRGDFRQRFITPAAAASFQRLSGEGQSGPTQGGGFSVKAPNGKTYNFKDQASMDAFKKAAGIQ